MNISTCSDELFTELIETLWNVNCIHVFNKCDIAKELIETLWNVNEVGEKLVEAIKSN